MYTRTTFLPGGRVVTRGGALPKVRVEQRLVKGKKVTTCERFEHLALDAAEIKAAAQKKFACAASISAAEGQANADAGRRVVRVQGEVAEALAALLCSKFGLPDFVIDVRGVKKKRGRKRR